MEYTRHLNELYPLSTEVGTQPDFIKNRVKEIKKLTSIKLEIDEKISQHTVKILSVTKAKVNLTQDDLGEDTYHFSCKVKLRLAD